MAIKMFEMIRYNWNIRGGRKWYKHVSEHVGLSSILLPSLEELLYQLDRYSRHKKLLQLLYYGKGHPNYNEVLLQVSMKYAHIGSMSYYMPGRGCRKPPLDVYAHILVESFSETVGEVKGHLAFDLNKENSEIEAQVVFNKFIYVMKLMLPLMACCREAYWAHYYRLIIEYVVEMDASEVPACKDMWSVFPLKLKGEYGEQYDNLPEVLREGLKTSNSNYGNIWE